MRGYFRNRFFSVQGTVEQDGEAILVDITHKKPNVWNRVPEHMEQAVVQIAIDLTCLQSVPRPLSTAKPEPVHRKQMAFSSVPSALMKHESYTIAVWKKLYNSLGE